MTFCIPVFNISKETVSIPWLGIGGENVAVNPFLNNPAAFTHWMASNGLMPGMFALNPLFEMID
jgi:hypothetical protein